MPILATILFVLVAAGVVFFVAAFRKDVSARKARVAVLNAGSSSESSLTPVDEIGDVVLVVELQNSYPVEKFNNLPMEQKYVQVGPTRHPFQLTRATTTSSPMKSESIVLCCIVPTSTTTATLHLGSDAGIPLTVGNTVHARLELK